MGMFGGGGEGSWSISSESDPRWNMHGRGFITVTAGGGSDVKAAIAAKKKELGEEPPEDLTLDCMKD